MKTVIYKENGVYKTTSEKNYNSTIQNAREIHTMNNFESAEEIIEYYIKWFKCNREDFIVMYDVYGKQYDAKGLREGYKTITGIAYDDEIYDKPLTDEEIYQYLLDALREDEDFKDGNFINDEEKMKDFYELTKEEFLFSYSYLTEEEYDNTAKLVSKQ